MRLTAIDSESLDRTIAELIASTDDVRVLSLAAGATYPNVSIVLPFTGDSRYDGIRIVGNRTKLIGRADEHLLHIGRGWDAVADAQWSMPKIKGVELSGIDFDIRGNGVVFDFTDRGVVSDCSFADSPREALITSGGGSSRNTSVSQCRAVNCGNGWSAGGLAAFNLNGAGDRLEYSTARNCGSGVETGGTGVMVSHCSFSSARLLVGSAVHGCSDVSIANCDFQDSQIEVGNGVGKLSDFRLLNSVCVDSPVCWLNAKPANKVTAPDLPFSDRRSLVAGNTFLGHGGTYQQALRLTNWSTEIPTMPLDFVGNLVDVPAGWGVVVQGYDPGDVVIEDNWFKSELVGVYSLNLPDGTPLPDNSKRIKWGRNRKPGAAWFQIVGKPLVAI